MLLSGDILTYSPWRKTGLTLGCQTAHWMPEPARFASYIAQNRLAVPLPSQLEDEWSSSSAGSTPEHDSFLTTQSEEEAVCGWRACGLSFPNVSRLSAHLAKKHGHPHTDGLFYCAWVGCTRPHRGFNARYKMLVHVRTHTNERPHTCAQCHKSFSRAENLKIHIRSHSGEKPYVCPYEGCGKAYSNSSDRFKHTRTHAEDKPYCCKVSGCNKRYTDPSSLRKHVKTYKHFTKPEEHSSSEETFDKKSNDQHPNFSISPNIQRPNFSVSPNIQRPNFSVSPTIRSAPSVILSPSVVPNVDERLSPYEDRRYITIPSMKLYQVPGDISNATYSNIFHEAYRKHEGIGYIPYPYERYNLDNEDSELKKNALPCPLNGDAPLNLTSPDEHRGRAFKIHPIEESMEFQLVRTMDTPLDLSNKTST